MKTVSFQGTSLTRAERTKLVIQRRPTTNIQLVESVNQALQVSEQSKSAGEKTPRWWTVERVERGTPYVGDIFLFH